MKQPPKKVETAVRGFFRSIARQDKTGIRRYVSKTTRTIKTYPQAIQSLSDMGSNYGMVILFIDNAQYVMQEGFEDFSICDSTLQVRMNGIARKVRIRCINETAPYKSASEGTQGAKWGVVPASMYIFPEGEKDLTKTAEV